MNQGKAKILKKIQASDWDIQNFSGLPLYLICAAGPTGWMLKKAVGVNYRHFFFQFQGGHAEMFYDKADLKRVGNAYYKKIKNLKQLAKLKRLYNLTFKKTAAGVSKHASLQKLSDKELAVLARQIRDTQIFSVGSGHVLEGVSYISEVKLKQTLTDKRQFSHENIQLLSSPVSPSFLLTAQNLLWKIKHLKGQAQKLAMENFIKKYSWIENTYTQGKLIGKREIFRKAKAQKRPAGLNSFAAIKKQKAALIKKLKFNKNDLFVVETVEFCARWQDERKENILRNIGKFEPVICELAKRLNLKPEQLKFILPEELNEKCLFDPKFLAVLKKRRPSCSYYTTPRQTLIFDSKDFTLFKKGLEKQSASGIRELRGTVANSGLASGIVKICHNSKDIRSFKKGQILVAPMTRPEYLPAMQKATAIVTDEGGITSHAAIISRELNIPCVIGTKFATKIFKDGDMVEVNADRGWARKIK